MVRIINPAATNSGATMTKIDKGHRTSMTKTTPSASRQDIIRPDLSNRALRMAVLLLAAALAAYFVAKPALGPLWQKPGTPVMQSLAIIGSLLLLVPFLFSFGKRGGYSRVPNRLFILHIGASLAGIGLVSLHAMAQLDGPPLLMLGGLAALVLTGMVGRIYAGPVFATTFGMKAAPFSPPDAATKDQLRAIIAEKTALLTRLDPAASEALFSVTLAHLIKQPRLSVAYLRLARLEADLIGTRRSVPWLAAWWRPLHILLAWLFVGGMITHIIVVSFFAGYVAEGRLIYWWHITAW
jgi:hypothetical protein